MKTEAELKNLAEKAAEFLSNCTPKNYWMDKVKWRKCDPHHRHSLFFSVEDTAPILAHLGKREMEKRGWSCVFSSGWSTQSCKYNYAFTRDKIFTADNENEYIALWLAIEQTGEK